MSGHVKCDNLGISDTDDNVNAAVSGMFRNIVNGNGVGNE